MRQAAEALSPSILRAYDIRGVVGEDLNEPEFFAIGRAFAEELHRIGAQTAAVGYDGRLSSPSLASALTDGLVRSGIDVTQTGRGPSPMLYFASHHLGTDAGLMITGSHNPPDHNGLKMLLQGKAFFGDDIQRLGETVASKAYCDGEGKVSEFNVFELYVERLLHDFRPGKALSVAWDPGNGAAGEVAKALTQRLPGSHHIINDEIDGTFPSHHPDPTVEENLAQLKRLVSDKKCDLGIAFDGDGDRIGVVDSRGQVMWGDQLLTVLAREVLAEQPGAPILCDVKASRIFFDEITRLGGEPVMYKAGHSHIKSKMQELNAPLAGEMSAHIFFKHRYYGYDDALYAAIRLLSIVANGEESVADILDAMPAFYNTPEVRFECPDETKFDVMDEITARVNAMHDVRVIDVDGVRVETSDGWWLLRASNTQPMLTLRCESTTEEGLMRLKDNVSDQLRAIGVTPPAF